ncbi:MAG: hypothetical protein K0U15_05570 [Proteobacteria bacterium]|nr:hypothetical protein [Pseudomonadota bacterium]
MSRIFFIFSIFLMSGCAATLEDFQEMSSYERTELICKRHQDVVHLSSKKEDVGEALSDTQLAISRGFRIFESCKKIPTVKVLGEECSVINNSWVCENKIRTDYETVCEETPVAIDGDLEKEKLEQYEASFDKYSIQLQDAIDHCRNDTRHLNAQDAFYYYQTVKAY